MDRQFVRTAAVVLCAAWAAGCGSTPPDKPVAPTQASATPRTRSVQTADLPTTLEGEIARAHALRLAGSYDEAGKALAQLMLVAPDDVRVVGEYGKVLAQEGRPGDALPFLARAVVLSKDDWTLYSALGVVYDQADQHTKARAAYDHALALKPGQPDVLNNYAVSLMLSGDYAGAQKMLAQAARPGTGGAKIDNNMALLVTLKHSDAVPPKPQAHAATPPAPKAVAGVVMEKVPTDPKAGPVGKPAPHKLAAKAHKPPVVALRHQVGVQPPKKAVAVTPKKPDLRTAADGQ